MRILRRIVFTLLITCTFAYGAVTWILPTAVSFYAVRKAPECTFVVPVNLKESMVAENPGTRLAYFGYEFELPWTDIDEAQTKLFPVDKPEKTKVDIHFRSGLRLLITAIPPGEWAKTLSTDLHISQKAAESMFGQRMMSSDYKFVEGVYEFNPRNMKHWGTQPTLTRDEVLLTLKAVMLSKWAQSGIYNLQTREFKGYQQGNPQLRQDGILVSLYSDEGGLEFIFSQKNFKSDRGVSQPEINRIIQSVQRRIRASAGLSGRRSCWRWPSTT